MWVWMKSHPWTFIIAGVIALLAVGGVVYALATHKRRMRERDRGLMIRDGFELRWTLADIPLAVWFHPELPGVLRDAWEAAAVVFERAVGRAVFMRAVEAPDGLELARLPPGNVGVIAGEPKGAMQTDHGRTEHRYDKRDGYIISALVTLPWSANGALQRHIAIHEAGHVLGLDHDDRTDSIMFPTLSARQEPGKLSELDAERLRKLYRRPTQQELAAVKR